MKDIVSSLLHRRLDFLSHEARTDALLPWVISVMMFLSCLAVAASLSVHSGLAQWSEGLESRVSIQVLSADVDENERLSEDALKMLLATPGIRSASIVASQEVLDLVSPWLGDVSNIAGLPLPTLIDVELANAGAVDLSALSIRLSAISDSIKLDNHQAWMRQLLDFATMIKWAAAGIVLLILMSTIAIVIFGCRAGLATHRISIEIMHQLGAEDSLIAREFDQRYLMHGLKGGVAGLVLALTVLYVSASFVADLGQGMLASVAPSGQVLAALIGLPVVAAVITMLTARITVRRSLLDML